mmetsp:Transcript_101/g.127  ORF Transcript_101/g.127 Transcript_101/m.127 type:complete len:433 (-) Transcript_101:116-1414(-)
MITAFIDSSSTGAYPDESSDLVDGPFKLLLEHLESVDFSSGMLLVVKGIANYLLPTELARINRSLALKEWHGEDLVKFQELKRLEAKLRLTEVFIREDMKVQGLQRKVPFKKMFENIRSGNHHYWVQSELKHHFVELTASEVSAIQSEIESRLSLIADEFQESTLNEEQTELMLGHIRQSSIDIHTKAKALQESHLTINKEANHYLMVDRDLFRVRSGRCQVIKRRVGQMSSVYNYDDSIIYYKEIFSSSIIAVDLNRDLAETVAAEVLASAKNPQIAVFEGYIYAIDSPLPTRFSMSEGHWEDIPPLPISIITFSLVLKKETRKLYTFQSDFSELTVQELSLDDLSWRVLKHSLSENKEVFRWVNHPYSPLILFTNSDRNILAFNPEAPDDVKKVGETTWEYGFYFATKQHLVLVCKEGRPRQYKITLAAS